jgi:hypothetical protein
MAGISFNKEEHNFGTIRQGIPVTYTFTFTNTGNAPLVVRHVQPGCSCTVPEWTKDPVQPGKKGKIRATFNAAETGAFSKDLNVICNAGMRPTARLYLVGVVK